MNIKKILSNHSKITLAALAVLFTGLFVACDDSNDQQATMRVMLTDAPAFYEEVNIEITQVLVNKDEDEDLVDGEEAEDNGWEVIMDESMRVNLLDYQHGATLELGETEIEPGQYNQLRLVLGTNNDVVIGGQSFPLTTPSAQQSGYKLQIQADVEAGEMYELVIDFDASQSIVVTGNGGYILRPVLRTVDLEQTGSISGTVLPVEAEPFIYAIMDGDTVGTQPDDVGDFRITGLSSGTYDVYFEPTDETFADSLFEDIVVVDDEDFVFEETVVLRNQATVN